MNETTPKEPAFMPSEEMLSLAMAYVPFQKWTALYEPAVGFDRGTLFRQLDLPFIGEEAVPRGR